MGKPQGIDFMIETLDYMKNNKDIFFFIIGSGTEYKKIEKWYNENKNYNTLLMPFLQKSEYDLLIKVCDVGMIFLDKRFTIPNFPSRLLSYLENKLPVLAATDRCTDLRYILENNKIGFWSEAGDKISISENISVISSNKDLRIEMGLNGYKYFIDNYTVKKSYETIMKHFEPDSSPEIS
jgi:glycosyltransferase involved in cell wall biosynthesis